MKVAIIHNHPIHYKHLLFRELVRLGLDIEILYTAAASSHRLEHPYLCEGSYRYRIGFAGPYEDAPTLGSARFVWRSLKEIQPDVVIIGGYYDVACWAGWAWARMHSKRLVLWAESNAFDRPRRLWKEILKRWFVSYCDAAHVYGITNKEYLEQLGMPRERIFIKRAVANTSLFLSGLSGAEDRSSSKVLLYVGRFSPEKNLPFLLRAFARVPQCPDQPRMVLALVGYGPQEKELVTLVRHLELSRLVEFWGPARQSDLPAIYRKADAFILPSLSEPWGLVVLEAMLCALPVLVSSRCGCAADLALPECGWTFSPFDEEGLAALLDRVSHLSRSELRAMGCRGQCIAMEYSPEKCARRVADSLCALELADRMLGTVDPR